MIDNQHDLLLVEDEESHVEAVRRAFRHLGDSFRLRIASDLQGAASLLAEQTPDLVIADWMLPDGKGTDLLSSDEGPAAFPVIVMTSRGNEQAAVEAMKAGALDYVVKSPQVFAEMPRTVERALREWGHICRRKRAEEELRNHQAQLEMQNEELRLAQIQLERSRDNYSELYDFAPVGYFTVNERGVILEANLTTARLLGIDKSNLINRPFSGFLGREDAIVYDGHLRQVLERGTKDSCELQVLKRDGTRFHGQLESLPVKDSGGVFNRCRTVLMDITERKKVEQALRESEERFRAVFESAGEYICIKDRSLRYTHVNPAMRRLLGFPASKIVGKHVEELLGKEAAEKIAQRDKRVLAGESLEMEEARTMNGVQFIFHDTVVPLRSSQDQIIGICCISRNVTERRKLSSEPRVGRRDFPSKAMRNALKKAEIAARTDSIILLQGESGSGKDYLARWMHEHSKRTSGPFFSINCSALPRELAESELFGHERGAFTGATGLKRGLLELAEGGTILLNEIGELDLPLQAKLLTFLDTQSFLRVGGQKQLQVNARLMAATHRDLPEEVAERRFLEPLFYRLSVFPLRVPALRERPEDIPILAQEIISSVAAELQLTEVPRLEPVHIKALSEYPWPGNVRELRNVLERSLILWEGAGFSLAMPTADIADEQWSYTVRYVHGTTLRAVTDEVKTFLCDAALQVCGGNKRDAAKALDVSRDSFYRFIRRLERKSKNRTGD
jgi:PAS domain S-box-containing protein